MNQKFFRFILIALIFLTACLLFINIFIMSSESGQCLSNPIMFGVRQLEKANKEVAYCDCRLNIPNSLTLHVNNKSESLVNYAYPMEFPLIKNVTD